MGSKRAVIQTPKFGYFIRFSGDREINRGNMYATREAALEAAGKELATWHNRYNCEAYLVEVLGTVSIPTVPPEFTPLKRKV